MARLLYSRHCQNIEKNMNCLVVSNPKNIRPELLTFLDKRKIDYAVEPDHLRVIQHAYESDIKIAIIDVDNADLPVENMIRILRERNPKIRILVCATNNSRDLETRVRKENIYFYHLKSFGFHDFSSALQSALGVNAH